jgi:hypothetical protein
VRTEHYIAYPMAVCVPLSIAAIVLAEVYDWSNGALGGIILVLLAITATVGSLLAPEDL